MVSERMKGLGTARSVIRELFEYGKLRAAEIGAEVILLAKNVDGVYSADPVKDPSAVKYDSISYDDVLAQHLMVMDTHIPVLLFALKDPENILRAVCGEKVGTIVKE